MIEQAGLGEPRRERRRQRDGVAAVEPALQVERLGVEGRGAATGCRRRATTASATATGRRTTPSSSRPAAGCPVRGPPSSSAVTPPAMNSVWLRATAMGPSGVTSHDHRDMGGRIAGARHLGRHVLGAGRQQVVERHHAIGELVAEAADIADREHVGRDQHGELAVIDIADPRGRDQGLGAELAERVAERRRAATGAAAAPRSCRRGSRPGSSARIRQYSAAGCRLRASVCRPSLRSLAAIADTMRSASAKVMRRGAPCVKVSRSSGSEIATASGRKAAARRKIWSIVVSGPDLARSDRDRRESCIASGARCHWRLSGAARHQVSGR